MSTVLKKEDADKLVFKHNPKFIRTPATDSAKAFVNMQEKKSSDFEIAGVVSEQAGIAALKARQLEEQVEETVLERLKEIEEKAYKGAYDLGLIEGREKAYEEKKIELMSRIDKLDLLCKGVEDHLEITAKESESVIIKLLFKIAERIALRSIGIDHEPIIELLKNIIQELQSAQRIVVQINPGDLKFVEEQRAANSINLDLLKRVKFEANDRVLAGGCLVETDFGTVDASVEQRVIKAWQALESKLPVIKDEKPTGQS